MSYDELLTNLAFHSYSRPRLEGGEFGTKMDAQISRNTREALRKRDAKTLKTEC